jgi:hypothetical protein
MFIIYIIKFSIYLCYKFVFVGLPVAPLIRITYPHNRPWRHRGLWDVESPTFSRRSAYRWHWGQLYALAAIYLPGRSLVLISVSVWVELRAIVRLEGLGQSKRSSDLIGNRIRDLPACSIVPQPSMLPRPPFIPMHTFPNLFSSYSDWKWEWKWENREETMCILRCMVFMAVDVPYSGVLDYDPM